MEEQLMTISEFARLSRCSRKTLIFYHRAGVFFPARTGKNGYRGYSLRQLQVINVILSLRAIHVPLPDIKRFMDDRSPKKLMALCQRQEGRIREEVRKLEAIGEVIASLNMATESAAAVRAGRFEILELPAARLFMGPETGSMDMDDINRALTAFYDLCEEMGVPQTHPLGSTIPLDGGKRRSAFRPGRFYCPANRLVPRKLTVTRPRGSYLVGYARGDYGNLDDLYLRLLRHAKRNGFAIQGDAYEEYMLSEMAVADPDRYLARVAMRIAP